MILIATNRYSYMFWRHNFTCLMTSLSHPSRRNVYKDSVTCAVCPESAWLVAIGAFVEQAVPMKFRKWPTWHFSKRIAFIWLRPVTTNHQNGLTGEQFPEGTDPRSVSTHRAQSNVFRSYGRVSHVFFLRLRKSNLLYLRTVDYGYVWLVTFQQELSHTVYFFRRFCLFVFVFCFSFFIQFCFI